MKYTKEQLRAMSDFEVSKALAKLVCKTHVTYSSGRGGIVCAYNKKVDYCNTPNYIMPLAFEHGIWIQSVDGMDGRYWTAGANTYHAVQHDNPLRAIACCLILVLQGEKE